jgi:hypothetical protein
MMTTKTMNGTRISAKPPYIDHSHYSPTGARPRPHARELLRRLHGDKGDEIVDRVLATTHASPFHFLRMHEPTEVLQHLRDEHPQTIALVLAHLPARLGATLLAGLDGDVQVEVGARLANLERAAPPVGGGGARARGIAKDTMRDVRDRMGFDAVA